MCVCVCVCVCEWCAATPYSAKQLSFRFKKFTAGGKLIKTLFNNSLFHMGEPEIFE